MPEHQVEFEQLAGGGQYASDARHTFVVKRLDVETLELCDHAFHARSPVLLPEPHSDSQAERRPYHEPLKLIAAALGYAEANAARKLIVLGHCSATSDLGVGLSLSERRAMSVHAYLSGDRDSWAACCAAHTLMDLQRVLSWCARFHGVDCDPGEITGTQSERTHSALDRFRAHYNAAFGGQLLPGALVDEEDWKAFYDYYDLQLAAELGVEPDALSSKRSALHFVEPAFLGCGAAWADRALGETPPRSRTNDRVDLAFILGEPLPPLDAWPPGLHLYRDARRLLRRWVEPAPSEPAVQIVDVRDAANVSYAGSAELVDVKEHGELTIQLAVTAGQPTLRLWIEYAASPILEEFYSGYALPAPQVAQLLEERRAAGLHRVPFDGRDTTEDRRILLPGEYVLKVEADFGGGVVRRDETTLSVAYPQAWNHGMDYTSHKGVKQDSLREADHATAAQGSLHDGTCYIARTESSATGAEAAAQFAKSGVAHFGNHANPEDLAFVKGKSLHSDITQRFHSWGPDDMVLVKAPRDYFRDLMLLVLAGCRAGNEIYMVQSRLHFSIAPRLDPKGIDGVIGDNTRVALATYKKVRALQPEDDTLDAPLFDALGIAPQPSAEQPGEESIKDVQRALTRLSRDLALRVRPGKKRESAVDGKYGPDTERAIENFQRAAGLEVNGVPDEPTIERLRLDDDRPAQRNVAETIMNLGADVTLGWETTVMGDECEAWAEGFWGTLAEGGTLAEAHEAGLGALSRAGRARMRPVKLYSKLAEPEQLKIVPARYGRGV